MGSQLGFQATTELRSLRLAKLSLSRFERGANVHFMTEWGLLCTRVWERGEPRGRSDREGTRVAGTPPPPPPPRTPPPNLSPHPPPPSLGTLAGRTGGLGAGAGSPAFPGTQHPFDPGPLLGSLPAAPHPARLLARTPICIPLRVAPGHGARLPGLGDGRRLDPARNRTPPSPEYSPRVRPWQMLAPKRQVSSPSRYARSSSCLLLLSESSPLPLSSLSSVTHKDYL